MDVQLQPQKDNVTQLPQQPIHRELTLEDFARLFTQLATLPARVEDLEREVVRLENTIDEFSRNMESEIDEQVSKVTEEVTEDVCSRIGDAMRHL